jgi:hypothetical protein
MLLALVGMALSSNPEPEQANTGPTQPTQVEPRELDDPASPADDGDNDTADSPSVTISTERGDVDIRFDPGGVARASVDGGTEFDLVQGTESGLRLDSDGRLEPVPPGQIEPDDLGLTPTGRGIDVLSPGNPVVELRPDGVTGGISATEFDGDNATTLTPNDGVVELNDGSTISPVEPPADGLLVAAPAGPMPWRWIFTTIAALAVGSATIGYLLHRGYQEAELRVPMAPTTTRIDENFEQFLARLAADDDPTRAIRLGFHAVEQGLSGLPVRDENETPFEWHHRVANTVPTVDEPLGRICDLFAKARFAPGDATEDDRRRMIEEIRTLVTGVHTPAPTDGVML